MKIRVRFWYVQELLFETVKSIMVKEIMSLYKIKIEPFCASHDCMVITNKEFFPMSGKRKAVYS